MSITIRIAAVSDAEAIAYLNQESMGYDYPLGETAKKLSVLLTDPIHRIFVAVSDGCVVGYIHACDYELLYAPGMKNILGIAVSPNHRREGIGRLLMVTVEDWAKETGAAGIRLVSGANRKDAHQFYRSCGFGCEKEQINFKKMV